VFEAAKALTAAGKPAFKIVYASSAAVFGPDEDYKGPVTDVSAAIPNSMYGGFKLCCGA
jgi:UDP-glucose 4-epimerase